MRKGSLCIPLPSCWFSPEVEDTFQRWQDPKKYFDLPGMSSADEDQPRPPPGRGTATAPLNIRSTRAPEDSSRQRWPAGPLRRSGRRSRSEAAAAAGCRRAACRRQMVSGWPWRATASGAPHGCMGGERRSCGAVIRGKWPPFLMCEALRQAMPFR